MRIAVNKQSFVAGTSILIGAGLVTRVLGFVYRIAITRLIGAEGIGLFQMVFPILTLLLTLVTAGMGVAISKIVAESAIRGDQRRIRRVMLLALVITGGLAALATIALLFFGKALATHLFSDPRAYVPFVTLTPLLGIIAVSSVLRGYFQGLQVMSTPSMASIVETVVRIVGVWILSALAFHRGLEYAAAGIAAGMICGELMGCAYMYWVYRRKARVRDMVPLPSGPLPPQESIAATLRAMLQIAVPVTASRFIGSIAYALEPVVVTRSLLAAGLTTSVATRLYGEYGGMAIPLLIFPTVFTYSLAVQLVPSVAEAVAAGQHKLVRRRLNQSFRVTAIIGLPASLLLLQFATPLCQLVFNQPQVGPILAVMAPCGFLLYLQGPLSGVLQGLNRAGIAMRNSLIGSAAKLLIIYWLASQPAIAILGVAWSLTVAVTLTTVLHIASVNRLIGFSVDVRDTVKIAMATLALALVTHALWLPVAARTPLAIALPSVMTAGLLVYAFLLLATGALTSRMLARVPGIGPVLAPLVRHIPFAH